MNRFTFSNNEEQETQTNSQEEISEEDVSKFIQAMGSAPEECWDSRTLVGYNLETRTVLIGEEITPEVANGITSQISWLDADSDQEPITVIINTPGGDVYSAFAIYDVMRSVKSPIVTLVNGQASSGGFLLAQGGDLRLAYPNARFFYHEVIQGAEVSTMTESKVAHDQYELNLRTMNDIIIERAKITKKVWNRKFKNHTAVYFTAKEALSLNLIDAILSPPSKNPFPEGFLLGSMMPESTSPTVEDSTAPALTEDTSEIKN